MSATSASLTGLTSESHATPSSIEAASMSADWNELLKPLLETHRPSLFKTGTGDLQISTNLRSAIMTELSKQLGLIDLLKHMESYDKLSSMRSVLESGAKDTESVLRNLAGHPGAYVSFGKWLDEPTIKEGKAPLLALSKALETHLSEVGRALSTIRAEMTAGREAGGTEGTRRMSIAAGSDMMLNFHIDGLAAGVHSALSTRDTALRDLSHGMTLAMEISELLKLPAGNIAFRQKIAAWIVEESKLQVSILDQFMPFIKVRGDDTDTNSQLFKTMKSSTQEMSADASAILVNLERVAAAAGK